MEKNRSNDISHTIEIIGICIHAILTYICVYLLVPHGYKVYFFIGICFVIFIPFIPLYVISFIKPETPAFVNVLIYILFSPPIILIVIFFIKLQVIQNHNYVIPGAKNIRFTVNGEWDLVDNEGVGDSWTKNISVSTDSENITVNSGYYTALIDSDIIVTASVKEDDSYDNDEELAYQLDFDDSAHNRILFPATYNIGKEQEATVSITVDALNRAPDAVREHGTAYWDCTVKIKRFYEPWDVILAKLNYDNIDDYSSYDGIEIGCEEDDDYILNDDGSAQYIPHDFLKYIYYTYEDVTMYPVKSKNISEIGYSKELQYFLVRYKSDDSLYVYIDVPEDIFDNLVSYEDPEWYYKDIIKPYFAEIQLE